MKSKLLLESFMTPQLLRGPFGRLKIKIKIKVKIKIIKIRARLAI